MWYCKNVNMNIFKHFPFPNMLYSIHRGCHHGIHVSLYFFSFLNYSNFVLWFDWVHLIFERWLSCLLLCSQHGGAASPLCKTSLMNVAGLASWLAGAMVAPLYKSCLTSCSSSWIPLTFGRHIWSFTRSLNAWCPGTGFSKWEVGVCYLSFCL